MTEVNLKKHPCQDCTFCQWCSDDRCRLCRGGHGCHKRKLSLSEQIELYEQINRSEKSTDDNFTVDRIESLGLSIAQPKKGYRFSIDPLLLADFSSPKDSSRIIDLGTGCAIIALVLAQRDETATFEAVEKQPELAAFARKNVSENQLSERINVIECDIIDLASLFPVSSFDLVLSNPPYRAKGSGKTSPDSIRDTARHESTATLQDFIKISKYLVKPSGRICFIYLAERLADLIEAARTLNLSITSIRSVHGTSDADARMILVEMVKGRNGTLRILPPLVIHKSEGHYSDELDWLNERKVS